MLTESCGFVVTLSTLSCVLQHTEPQSLTLQFCMRGHISKSWDPDSLLTSLVNSRLNVWKVSLPRFLEQSEKWTHLWQVEISPKVMSKWLYIDFWPWPHPNWTKPLSGEGKPKSCHLFSTGAQLWGCVCVALSWSFSWGFTLFNKTTVSANIYLGTYPHSHTRIPYVCSDVTHC